MDHNIWGDSEQLETMVRRTPLNSVVKHWFPSKEVPLVDPTIVRVLTVIFRPCLWNGSHYRV